MKRYLLLLALGAAAGASSWRRRGRFGQRRAARLLRPNRYRQCAAACTDLPTADRDSERSMSCSPCQRFTCMYPPATPRSGASTARSTTHAAVLFISSRTIGTRMSTCRITARRTATRRTKAKAKEKATGRASNQLASRFNSKTRSSAALRTSRFRPSKDGWRAAVNMARPSEMLAAATVSDPRWAAVMARDPRADGSFSIRSGPPACTAAHPAPRVRRDRRTLNSTRPQRMPARRLSPVQALQAGSTSARRAACGDGRRAVPADRKRRAAAYARTTCQRARTEHVSSASRIQGGHRSDAEAVRHCASHPPSQIRTRPQQAR